MTEGQDDTPLLFELKNPSPNPFTTRTIITYSIPQSIHVSLKIYDISGKCIRSLEDGHKDGGIHHVAWDGLDNLQKRTPAGAYFVRLETEHHKFVKKILLIQ